MNHINGFNCEQCGALFNSLEEASQHNADVHNNEYIHTSVPQLPSIGECYGANEQYQ